VTQTTNQNMPNIADNALNPLNAELIPVCHLLAFLGAQYILHVSSVKVNFVGYTLM